jgi:cyclohexanone monooxygenase
LKPYYNLFCKRPCFHDDYLPTFHRPNVTLVDTNGKGVDYVTEKGIVANGKTYELDTIIYATGFENNSDWALPPLRRNLRHQWLDPLTGVERWSSNFPWLGSQQFPQLFLCDSAQTAGVADYAHNLENQAKHLIYVISKVKAGKIERLEATEDAENEWMKDVIRASEGRAAYLKQCTPGYYNDEGQVTDQTVRNYPYGGGNQFFDIVGGWRKADTLDGMEARYPS